MYAYLKIWRDVRERVILPDGTSVLVADGEGQPRARAWVRAEERARTDEQTAPDPVVETAQDELDRLAEEHRAWQQKLDAALSSSRSITHGRAIREAFVAEHPEPLAPSDPTNGARTTEGSGIEMPPVTREHWWVAQLADGEQRPLSPHEPLPLDAIATHLSELEQDRWSVVDAQFRRAVSHSDTTSHTIEQGAMYLLHRA